MPSVSVHRSVCLPVYLLTHTSPFSFPFQAASSAEEPEGRSSGFSFGTSAGQHPEHSSASKPTPMPAETRIKTEKVEAEERNKEGGDGDGGCTLPAYREYKV